MSNAAVANYFKHIRSLGAFSAADSLALAREAAALDEAAEARKYTPGAVSHERIGNEQPMRLSFSIKCY